MITLLILLLINGGYVFLFGFIALCVLPAVFLSIRDNKITAQSLLEPETVDENCGGMHFSVVDINNNLILLSFFSGDTLIGGCYEVWFKNDNIPKEFRNKGASFRVENTSSGLQFISTEKDVLVL